MTQPDSNNIRSSITRFRRLALVSAALIMAVSLLMVYRITTVLNHGSASKINISGQQRTLSLKIRSDAFEIETAVRSGQWDKLPPLLEDLTTSTDRLGATHQQLFSAAGPEDLFANATTAQQDLVASIRVPFRQLVAASQDLQKLTTNTIRRAPYIDETTHARILAAQQEIARAQSLFLPRMTTIVDLFERASRDEINAGTRHARMGLAVLAAVLAATIVFIIEPTILIIRRQLRDLDRATRAAARADAVRWRLLTNMGHEFRTPMNAVMGFSELLRDDTLSPTERDRLVHSIFHASTQLTELIETMLDMSAIESGQLRTTSARCDLHQMLTRVGTQAAHRAAGRGLSLSTQIDPTCPARITTDPKRLEQIVHKLTDNAVKFTRKGGVEIHARLNDHATPPAVEITVTNTGIGIHPQSLSTIFDPFTQGQDDLTRNFGGAGLGLTIARDLARALGGDINIASTPGHGSAFTLTVPAIDPQYTQPQSQTQNQTQNQPDAEPQGQYQSQHQSQPQTLPDAPPTASHDEPGRPLTALKILIVDDAKDNRVLLGHIFRNTGADIEFAHDGMQAIHAVLAANETAEPFALILMDMQMPVLDGYAATARLRAQGVTTPIIALTAHALEGDRDRCLAAGCDDYITKPLNRAQLLSTCTRLTTNPSAPPAAAA